MKISYDKSKNEEELDIDNLALFLKCIEDTRRYIPEILYNIYGGRDKEISQAKISTSPNYSIDKYCIN